MLSPHTSKISLRILAATLALGFSAMAVGQEPAAGSEAASPAAHGADWSPQERAAIAQMRQHYLKSGGSMSPQQENAMVQQMRSVQAQMLGTAAAMQSMPGLMGGMAASPSP